MLNKILLIAFLLASFAFSEQKICLSDGKLLTPLFKLLLEYSEAGYVIYNKKPVCSVTYSKNPFFFDQFEPYEQLSVAVNAAKQLLKNFPFNSRIIFHFDEKQEMLLIINRKLFLSTVQKNLPLFQYALGPTITPESLLDAIIHNNKGFCEILDYDRVLIGIILGYGVQNALFESRLENIRYDGVCVDIPPFAPNVHLCSDESSKEAMLFSYEENSLWKKSRKFQKPSFGFDSLLQEKEAIEQKLVVSSKQLMHSNPNYIFVCLQENQEFLHDLESTQKKIKALLNSKDWLEKTLKLVYGKKIKVDQLDIAANISPPLDLNYCLAKLLKQELLEQGCEYSYFPFFIQGLLSEKNECSCDGEIGASSLVIRNIRNAKKKIEEANYFFMNLNKEQSFTPLLDFYLYYKVLENGSGSSLLEETRVCVDYEIYDPSNKCLSSAKEVNINLNETIPGFAQGIRGMQQKEQRIIYIHPSLAYGVHTFLEKGIYLKAIVKLHKIYDIKEKTPSLIPLDCAFVLRDQFQKKCEEDHKQALRFIGMKKGQFLHLCPGVNLPSIVKHMHVMSSNEELTQEESDGLNQFFWDLYFGKLE